MAAALVRLGLEDPAGLAPEVALQRTRDLLVAQHRLQAVSLVGVRDVDRRELFTLDHAGSTQSWLRRQLGGEQGQLVLARRLLVRPLVAAALAQGELSVRGAGQLCAGLHAVPDSVRQDRLAGVLTDGLRDLLAPVLGRTGLEPGQLSTAMRAVRAEFDAVVTAALADTTAYPAVRLEPAVLLLARHVPAAQLAWNLTVLLEGLEDREPDPGQRSRYYLALIPLLDGEFDLQGHLDHETGTLLQAELDRQERVRTAHTTAAHAAAHAAAQAQAQAADAEAAGPAATPAAEGDQQALLLDDDSDDDDSDDDELPTHLQYAEGEDQDADAQDAQYAEDEAGEGEGGAGGAGGSPGPDRAGAAFAALSDPPDPHASTSALGAAGTGTRRHDALCQLLRDARQHRTGSGRPGPAAITTTLAQLEGRPGALPALLHTPGPPVPLARATLLRHGCFSELNLVITDALGRPVGASTTLRSATRRQRAALTALWGPWCAITGCTNTQTVPHHVRPWWKTQQTVLADLLPLCDHDHRDLHQDHRTLRVKDGRLINEHGWITDPTGVNTSGETGDRPAA